MCLKNIEYGQSRMIISQLKSFSGLNHVRYKVQEFFQCTPTWSIHCSSDFHCDLYSSPQVFHGNKSPVAAIDRRIVTSLLSSFPATGTCLVPSFSIVHSLTGTSLEPVWSQLMIKSCGIQFFSTSSLILCRKYNLISGKSAGNLWAALVALRFTQPFQQRNDSAQERSMSIGPPCSFISAGFLWYCWFHFALNEHETSCVA